jgi:hypothetical protein
MRYRYIYRDGSVVAIYKNEELTYLADNFAQDKNEPTTMVMPDIKPYQSMIDGSMITSRSRHREHLREHGCLEVGNETKYLKPKPVQTPPGLKETVARVTYEKLKYGR